MMTTGATIFRQVMKQCLTQKPVLNMARSTCVMQIRCNSNKMSITKTARLSYARMYPTLLVHPDGSTIRIRYREPRRIVQLPVQLETLTEEERQLRLLQRKARKKIVIEEDIEDDFDASSYSQYWKK